MRALALCATLFLAACPVVDDAPGDDDDDAAEGEGEGEGEEGEGEEGEGEVPALAGFGEISGGCQRIDTELDEAAPSTFVNAIDFADDGYDDADLTLLTEGGQAMIADGNAGGSSLLSEVFALEVLTRCEGAVLLKTETEVEYDTENPPSITDILVEIDGQKVGVSVVRAVKFPFEDPYLLEDAQPLMQRKLEDILDSSAHVVEGDRWVKQILAVVAYSADHAAIVEEALDNIDRSVRADTIVLIAVTDGDDAFIY